MFRGLTGKHAYSVIGIRNDQVGGIDYIAVGVKNPWDDRFHREYKVKSGKLSPNGYRVIGLGHNTKGVSWLELSDFLKSFNRLYVGRNPVKNALHEELLDAVRKRNLRMAAKKQVPTPLKTKRPVDVKKKMSHVSVELQQSLTIVESEERLDISWDKSLQQ